MNVSFHLLNIFPLISCNKYLLSRGHVNDRAPALKELIMREADVNCYVMVEVYALGVWRGIRVFLRNLKLELNLQIK